ncbi:PAS domain-containing protein [Gallaecimonas kandeliae]|uniref:PAS domain-containing protein n=1 Tax=Gallaecimonas kandeliae TaxID=3029055 RepID=UPI00264729C1|nr:PAS domain-containing protein [Gallaecimonas kandeliae]WKE65303.1 PAS domain-containing protein [Gallaecimonas kandeliae]
MNSIAELNEIHWLVELLQNVDVGMVVLDRDYKVQIWNGFMENHSGLLPSQVKGKSLLECFPELDKAWFDRKAAMVFTLKSRAFMTWQQKPYLLRFNNYRPITGTAEHMFQNVTLFPLTGLSGEVTHMAMLIYDMTDSALASQGGH